MQIYTYVDADPCELYHWGILGQKWGIRRYQNPDGTLTAEGKKRYWGNGGDYTPVGRQRYIKDLVRDYNEVNGTNINSKKAVVRIDGKFYSGKGIELDPRNLEILAVKGKNRYEDEADRRAIKITGESTKRDIDRKPNSEMTSEELAIAQRYYQTLNNYEKAGAEYSSRHRGFFGRQARFIGGQAEARGQQFVSEFGQKGISNLVAAIVAKWQARAAEGEE